MNTHPTKWTSLHAGRSSWAFTLIEMVVSLSIISIIFLAMGSVMVLASKALPSADTVSTRAFDATETIHRLASELETAKTLTVSGTTAIEFTVADRDGDSNDEIISYEWPGGAGQPLLRQYNGGNTVAVLPNTYEFVLTYDTKTVAQPDLLNESAEVELASYPVANASDFYDVGTAYDIAQYFLPTNLPAGTVGWNVTRVLVSAKKKGSADGETQVQLRPAVAGGMPDTTVLEEYTMLESDLGNSYTWQEFNYSTVRDRLPGEGLCVVLSFVSGGTSASFQVDDSGGSGLIEGKNEVWTSVSGKSMVYYVYGTYTTNTPQPPIVVVKSVTLTLNAGASPASRALTKVVTLNQPVMP